MPLLAASAFLLASPGARAADPWKSAPVTVLRADWDAVRADAATLTDASAADALTRLNDGAGKMFATIHDSAAPVLLPFNVKAYLSDLAVDQAKPLTDYSGGFQITNFFLAGPAGYDAAFALRSGAIEGLVTGGSEPVAVEISASTLLYDLPPANGLAELPVRGIEKPFAKIRRFILENYLRYTFERYGLTYVVSISCFDGRPRARWISCVQADRIAQHFLNQLNLAGGNPDAGQASPFVAGTRPSEASPDFTYYPAGRLIPGSGFARNNGVADPSVYANIRFPYDKAPAFANSQSFMNWGDCDQTGRIPPPRGRKDAAYRCRVTLKPLVFNEGAPENYFYPWRDSFCERRHYFVGQCPAGQGHQGVDIRPAACKQKNEGADRCEPYLDDLVAVRAGMILRTAKQESVYLTTNSASEHVRFRYMHMNPRRLDDDNVLNGRVVKEGEIIGKAGNFNRRDNFTTYHLHFELMVPTRDGWTRVNPYMTLVAAYERLLGARGRQIEDNDPIPDASLQASQASESKAEAPRAKKRQKGKRKRQRRH